MTLNFNGGDLSSDAGFLLIREFAAVIGLIKLVRRVLKTNDPALCHKYTDPDNFLQHPEYMVFDLNSTLLSTYGNHEGEEFNFHYQAHGYHPLVCFDGITGDLPIIKLQESAKYCSNDVDKFMLPLHIEFRTEQPSLPLYLRSDSGFASSSLYKTCEENDCNPISNMPRV